LKTRDTDLAAHEVNFDGLVGPTHNYAGLSYGNIASTTHKATVSHPREAALQGLAKMKFLASLGVKQAILPPQERPHLPTLRRLGFTGTDAQVLEKAHRENPALLAACCSSSSMWTANAATVSPSADTADRRVHFTPANLISQFHRSIEPATTARILQAIFADDSVFAHHPPLPSALHFSDEGAANHMRLCRAYDEPGIEIFVYGRRAFDPAAPAPTKFPARQTREACAAIARNHLLDPARVLFVQQNPQAIDAGAFHNDVVAVANQNLLLHHADAFAAPLELPAGVVSLPAMNLSFEETVASYVFNSQLVTLPDGSMALIAPVECQAFPNVQEYIGSIASDQGPIRSVYYVDVRQSMQNGGGPACLRLRVVLTEQELARAHPGVFFTDALHARLAQWIERHYRETIEPRDLVDPKLLAECRAALDELTQILALPPIYEFQ
jgi:succinylarginine dihydrolase